MKEKGAAVTQKAWLNLYQGDSCRIKKERGVEKNMIIHMRHIQGWVMQTKFGICCVTILIFVVLIIYIAILIHSEVYEKAIRPKN